MKARRPAPQADMGEQLKLGALVAAVLGMSWASGAHGIRGALAALAVAVVPTAVYTLRGEDSAWPTLFDQAAGHLSVPGGDEGAMRAPAPAQRPSGAFSFGRLAGFSHFHARVAAVSLMLAFVTLLIGCFLNLFASVPVGPVEPRYLHAGLTELIAGVVTGTLAVRLRDEADMKRRKR